MAESNTTKQQREFVRVDDLLPFSWRVVSEEEFRRVMTHFEKHGVFPDRSGGIQKLMDTLDISGPLKKLERADPTLAQIMSRLDVKLNLLIRLFHPSEDQKPLVPTPVNLSGGGLAFWEAGTQLTEGQILEFRLALSLETVASVECYGRVMKVFMNDRDGMAKMACKFEPILDQHREKLIQHIFRKQAELLRAKRNG
ncbi:MAG: PilZ domain-containing protein [Magnetococcales bacterium]|nr:PilZ domain-containing protein [Magnetococcales bacterium]MBF0155774.1 PilZ domain-containing protein [Magnetococcales bacterium]